MTHDPNHLQTLRELLSSQLLGVLGTHHEGEPYTSLVGFAASEDLSSLFFATGRQTRKHENLLADARASMLVDNRTNSPTDFTEASAATAVGVVAEVGRRPTGGFRANVPLQTPPARELRPFSELCSDEASGVGLHGGDPLSARHRASLRLMPFIIGLDHAEATNPKLVGGKGAALAALANRDVRIPATLCLTTRAYELFVENASRGSSWPRSTRGGGVSTEQRMEPRP